MSVTFTFDDVSCRALAHLVDTVRDHGVEFSLRSRGAETLGTFRSIAGSGTFAHDGRLLTVTILHEEGHFSALMVKGGLRQLVSEAVEHSDWGLDEARGLARRSFA